MKFLVAVLILLVVLLLPISAANSARLPSLTATQKQVIVKAYHLGGVVLAAIILQESSACVYKIAMIRFHTGKPDHAYGCGQLHSKTADNIYGSHVPKYVLIHEQDLNMEIAYQLLRNCVAEFGWYGGITCYQAGQPATSAMTKYQREHSDYLTIILRRMNELRRLPKDTE